MGVIGLDIGNSGMKMGLFKEGALVLWQSVESAGAREARIALVEFLGQARAEGAIEGAAMASVVPALAALAEGVLSEATGVRPFMVTHESALGLEFALPQPSTLGADRIATAAAASELLGPPVVVVDFGTATTVNFIRKGERGTPVYAGGAIMPGMRMMAESLSRGTALLPLVALEGGVDLPVVPADTTEGNILAGAIYASVGGVEKIISAVEAAEGTSYALAITGGMSALARPLLARSVELSEPALSLIGIRILYERSRRSNA